MSKAAARNRPEGAPAGALWSRKTDLIALREFRLRSGEVIDGDLLQGFIAVAADIVVHASPFARRPNGTPYLSEQRRAPERTVDTFVKWFWAEEPGLVSLWLRERERCGRSYTHAEAGQLLSLQPLEANELGIGTMYPVGETVEERELRRRERKRAIERERSKQRRRAMGARPRSDSLSATQPWKAMGISRRTWYRKRGTNELDTVLIEYDGNASVPSIISASSLAKVTFPDQHNQFDVTHSARQGAKRSAATAQAGPQAHLADPSPKTTKGGGHG